CSTCSTHRSGNCELGMAGGTSVARIAVIANALCRADSKTMKISVIIPCRNERRHIADFLDSVFKQELDTGDELEILVADGMSDDGTRDILRGLDVQIIDNAGRIVSTGLNAAIEASSGEVIVRMDAHTIYAKDYIRECVHALRESGADNVGGPWVAKGR